MIHRILFVILVGVLGIFAMSCTGEKTADSSSTIAQDPEQKMQGSPLYVEVSTIYEGGTDSTVEGRCNIDTTNPSVHQTCTVRIPELRLHFSGLSFKIGTSSADTCAQISFQPYYYQRSSSAAYLPYGTTSIDCSATPPANAGCYGGAAPALLKTDFPGFKGLYFLPAVSLTGTFTVPSSNSRIKDADYDSFSTNVDTCNNLSSSQRATPTGTATTYYSGSNMYIDYAVSCNDVWANSQYSITLTIADDDSENTDYGATIDEYYDWGD